MNITIINPKNKELLNENKSYLQDNQGNKFPIINTIPRFVDESNYTQNFGFQWNKFTKTQVDTFSNNSQSQNRFFRTTNWDKEDLTGKNVLEVGSGAGRFSQIILDNTKANLYSVDYSDAVEANLKNNGHHKDRFKLFQASIYELPFPKNSFDKVVCIGVLQHTPDFKKSVKALTEMVKVDGELVVDFYPIKGWWTKIHAKYIFRPFTKKMTNEKLLSLIENNAGWLINLSNFFNKIGIGKLTNRFLPICDIKNTLPQNLSKEQLREYVILDTFDMFSPEYDQPQRLTTVKKWFEEFGMKNVWAEFVRFENTNEGAVVKGIK